MHCARLLAVSLRLGMLFCLQLAVLFSFVGPGVPSLAVFLLRPCLHCPVRGTGAATLRAPSTLCEA